MIAALILAACAAVSVVARIEQWLCGVSKYFRDARAVLDDGSNWR